MLVAASLFGLLPPCCTVKGPNTDPIIVEMDGTLSLNVNETAEYWCDAIDHDGDSLNYAWSCSRGSFSDSGKIVHWTAPGLPGTDTMSVVVDDGRGGIASKQLFVSVLPSLVPLTKDRSRSAASDRMEVRGRPERSRKSALDFADSSPSDASPGDDR